MFEEVRRYVSKDSYYYWQNFEAVITIKDLHTSSYILYHIIIYFITVFQLFWEFSRDINIRWVTKLDDSADFL